MAEAFPSLLGVLLALAEVTATQGWGPGVIGVAAAEKGLGSGRL
jgi:hypothetical protein